MRLASLALLALATTASAAPLQLDHQGRLFDSVGQPLQGPNSVQIALFDAPSGGNQLWSDTFSDVPFTEGYYHLTLGAGLALDDAAFDGDDVWMQLSVNGLPPLGRVALSSVPYALRANVAGLAVVANSVDGGVVNASELRVNGTLVVNSSGNLVAAPGTLSALACAEGEVPTYRNSDWSCGPASPAHTHDAADLTTGTLSVNRLPMGTSADSAAFGNHGHDLSTLDGQLSASQLPVGAIDLNDGSTMGGAPLATGAHYTDTKAVAALAPHTSDPAAHHTRYADSEAVTALAPHTSDPAAHHAAYTDADAIAAVGGSVEIAPRGDSRVSFTGTWTPTNGWGLNRLAKGIGESAYTNCTGNSDCSGDYVELNLASNTYRTVLLSDLDWSNCGMIAVYLSFDNGTNWSYSQSFDTKRLGDDNTPYTSSVRAIASNLPLGADVRVRVVAAKGRFHFEGFGLSDVLLPQTVETPIRQVAWTTGRSTQSTCDVNSGCARTPVAGRSVTFVKTQPGTAVRLQYTDNLRTYSADGTTRSCEWNLLVDGADCPSGPIFGDIHSQGGASGNDHRPSTVAGYCTGLGVGSHTVQVVVSSHGGYQARCYTGWENQTYMLEAEEIR